MKNRNLALTMEAEQAEACAAEGQPQCDDKFAPVCSMSILMTVTNENNEENDVFSISPPHVTIPDSDDGQKEVGATEDSDNLADPQAQEPLVSPATPTDSVTAMKAVGDSGKKGPLQNNNASQNHDINTGNVQVGPEQEHHDHGGESKEHQHQHGLSTSQSIASPPAVAAPVYASASAMFTTVAAVPQQSAVEQQQRQQQPQSVMNGNYHANAFLAAAAAASAPSIGISPAAAAAVANSTAERRGSGFLLLAAEAYEAAEKTQLRADAIRQVATELASKAGAQAAAADTASTSRSGSVAAATPPLQLQQGLQRQYDDASFFHGGQAPSFLQGLASGGQQRQHSNYPQDNIHSELDQDFRDQVYRAAAKLQLQQQREVQVAQFQAHATVPAPQYKTEEVPPQSQSSREPPKKRKLGSSGRSTFIKTTPVPPLPAAPLVPPTKQTFYERSNSESRESGSAGCSSSNLLPSGKPRPKPLKHVYHDYGSIPDSAHFARKKTGGVTMPFPEKLMCMIEKETLLHPDVVSWQSHGRAFMVRNPKRFTSEVMGGYFRQSKLTSFQRQLNLYGFRRITQGADAGAYYHELFLRGRPQLCMRMQRQKVKGTGHKQPTDVTSEPNFYAMPKLVVEGEQGGGAAAMDDCSTDLRSPSSSSKGMNPPLFVPPDGTTLTQDNSKQTAGSVALASSPTTSMQMNQQHIYYNSPRIRAASMLRKLSASKIGDLQPLSLSASSAVEPRSTTASQDRISLSLPTSNIQHGLQPTSYANTTDSAPALTAMGNGSEHGRNNSSASSPMKKQAQKLDYTLK